MSTRAKARTRTSGLRFIVACSFLATSIAACAGHRGPASVPATDSPATWSDPHIALLLNRAAFGPRPGEIERIRATGAASWIEQQLHPERIDDSRLDERLAALPTIRLTPRQLVDDYFRPAQEERKRRQRAAVAAVAPGGAGSLSAPALAKPPEPDAFKREREVLVELADQKLLRAVYSERQLQEVLTDFWFNHFNVFAGKGADRIYLGEYEREVIRPRVFGRFRDLLGAVASSPAMLFYLDNWLSSAPPPVQPSSRRPAARRVGLNENYARELMELHTLGVDGGYTQTDVMEVARCFTGWSIERPNEGGGFLFDPRRHDNGRKVVLGQAIEAGGGQRDGERVLDILARHPSTARLIAGKLARRFVADEPPPSLVARAARRFLETDGDLRETVRAILTSREFADSAARPAKVKTPLELVASTLRALGATVDNPAAVLNVLRTLGEAPYGCQTPNGYADRAGVWMNAGALVARLNFAAAVAANRLPGVRVDLAAVPLTPEAAALFVGSPQFQRR